MPEQPREHRRAPAIVLACLAGNQLRIILYPDVGLADGGMPGDVPIELVPPELRLPNTKLWVHWNDQHEIESVSHRDK